MPVAWFAGADDVCPDQQCQSQGVPLVIKGDMSGSIGAINVALENSAPTRVRVRIVHSGQAASPRPTFPLAETSGALSSASTSARQRSRRVCCGCEAAGIEIRYNVMTYSADRRHQGRDVRRMHRRSAASVPRQCRILEVFNITKVGKIAGCRETEAVERGAGVRLIRDDVVIHEGTLKTLKLLQRDEVPEVPVGQGMRVWRSRLRTSRPASSVLPRRDGCASCNPSAADELNGGLPGAIFFMFRAGRGQSALACSG